MRPDSGWWLASQPTLSRFEHGVLPRDMLRVSGTLRMWSSRAISGASSGSDRSPSIGIRRTIRLVAGTGTPGLMMDRFGFGSGSR